MRRSSKVQEIIMVMGVQRSGTSVLFESLATDKSLSAHPEDVDAPFYYHFRLRPLKEVVPLLQSANRRVLLKPISETAHRTLFNLREEYGRFPLRFVWIYRDPVNVLYSMYRQGWINAADMTLAPHLSGWCKRNDHALHFREKFPNQIAIVRYEDICFDAHVFHELKRWLNVESNSLFQMDSTAGRDCVPVLAQTRIDAVTKQTMWALDAARTFKPRIGSRFRHVATGVVRRFWRQRPEQNAGGTQTATLNPGLEQVAGPASVEGLHFWLDTSILPRTGSDPTELIEAGPQHMSATLPVNGPYRVASLKGKTTLMYPHTRAESRRNGATGILWFGAGHDSDAIAHSALTIFALFRPNVPCYAPYYQQQSKLLRIGSGTGESFVLGWSHENSAATAVIENSAGAIATSTPPGSHPRQEWRVVVAEYGAGRGGALSLSINGRAGQPVFVRPGSGRAEANGCGAGLEIGGVTGEGETLFYGEIAQIIVFKRALNEVERLSVAGFLTKKYQL